MDSPRSISSRLSGATARSPKSWPAQKPRPAPVSTSTLAPAAGRRSKACRTSVCMTVLKLLILSGRFRVNRAMPCSTLNRMVSYDIISSQCPYRSFFVVAQLEKSGGGARLAAQDESRIEFPGRQRNGVHHIHLSRNAAHAAGCADAGATGEREFEPRAFGGLEHGCIPRHHGKGPPAAIHGDRHRGEEFLRRRGGDRAAGGRTGRVRGGRKPFATNRGVAV